MNSKVYYRFNRERFVKHIALIALVAVLILTSLSVTGALISRATSISDVQSYTVNRGDTLWHIAKAHSEQSDVRPLIYRIKQLNQLETSDISPGQILLIPIEEG